MDKNLEAIRPDSLIEARHNLTAKENNIIDLVLNTIKDDAKYKYEIDIEKYKKIYNHGSTNIYRDLKNATDDIFENHNKFYIKDRLTGRERKFVWFSMIEYIPQKGKILFEVADTLKKMMLEMKKRIYYRIEYPINFKSLYSKRIYYMLKSFEDTGWRIDKIDDLKYKLGCPESYKNYAIFKQKVLDMAFKEINKSGDIKFKYEPIKKGRKVISIKFIITSNKAKNEIVATKEIIKKPLNDLIKQVQAICYKHNITEHEASCILSDANNNIGLIKKRYNYLITQKKVDNVVGYMRSIIVTYDKAQNNIKIDNFNNYEQREYDFDKLEKNLTAWK